MKINETFVRTSKNYGINEFDIENDIFDNKIDAFSGFSTNFDGKILKNNKLPVSPISMEAQKELENSNISLSFDIDKNYNKPIVLNFDFTNNELLVDRININVKNGVDAKLLLNYQSNQKCHHNGFVSLNCEENANLSCVTVFDLAQNSNNFISFENSVKEDANIDLTMVDFSGNYSVQRYICDVLGDNACSNLKTMYISGLGSKIDLNLAQNIYGKNSNASIKTIGALQGKSIKNFKGMIDFKRGSCKSKGDEEELCLLLSKDARSKALPLLCTAEEDVEGSHSSATGKIGENELFYIMSRGLDKTEGLKLLLKAKLSGVLQGVFDQNIKDQINEKIDRKIVNENN